MPRSSIKDRQQGWEDQRRSAGSDSYNPAYNPSQQAYDEKFNQIARQEELSNLENNWNAPYTGKNGANTSSLGEREQEPDTVSSAAGRTSSKSSSKEQGRGGFGDRVSKVIFKNKKMKKSGSLLTILLLIFGSGGFLTILLSPSLAIVQMKEIFTKSLNDQLHSVEERSTVLLRSKLDSQTKGICNGPVKIGCRMATATPRQIAKYRAAGIEVKDEPAKIFGGQRRNIVEMSFKDPDGKLVTIRSAAELHDALNGTRGFRAAMLKSYNPLFASLSDKVALSVMSKLKTSKSLVATGDTDEERQKKVNNAVSGLEDSGAKTVTVQKDKDGKDVYVDSEGNPLDADEVEAAQQQADRMEGYVTSGGVKGVLTGAAKGVSVIGAADSACTVYNSMRAISAMAKMIKLAQAARFAMAMVLTPADVIKAGDAKEDDVIFVGNNLTETHPSGTVLDESKLSDLGSANKPATKADPDVGKNAFDGPGYQLAADPNHAPTLNLRASRFMLAGGSVALMDKTLASIARIVNGGNPNPQQVSQKCRYIQNPAVRFTGLAIGVLAGLGSFGLTTALGIAGSTAIALALPYLEAQGAEMLAGNMFKDLSSIDSGDAAYVGSAGLFGTMAMSRGMKPLNKEEGVKYLAANRAAVADYTATQQYIARAEPFNIMNPYSFTGSIAMQLTPVLQRSKSSASAAMINITSLIPTSFASLTKPVSAMSNEYFEKCNDPAYEAIGIDAGPFCEVRYGLSKEELAMDPIANVEWMVANGQIDQETGEALSTGAELPDSTWNYGKFLQQCVNRTVGWGENQDENEGDGRNCIDPVYETINQHFRIYTIDKSVDESMDAEPPAAALPGTTGFPSGESGSVSSSGWAFPTVAGMQVTSGFKSAQRPTHRGVDIAGSAANTTGQPIFAAYDGVVKAAGPAQGFGNWIVIEHQVSGKVMSTVYGHMYADGVLVKVGDTVKAGQQIGKIGSAGQSTGPHLHFEIWDGARLSGGTEVDPMPYIGRPPAAAAGGGSIDV